MNVCDVQAFKVQSSLDLPYLGLYNIVTEASSDTSNGIVMENPEEGYCFFPSNPIAMNPTPEEKKPGVTPFRRTPFD